MDSKICGAYVNFPVYYASLVVDAGPSPINSIISEPMSLKQFVKTGVYSFEPIDFKPDGHAISDLMSDNGNCSISGTSVNSPKSYTMPINVPFENRAPYSPFFPKNAFQTLSSRELPSSRSYKHSYPPKLPEKEVCQVSSEQGASSASSSYTALSSEVEGDRESKSSSTVEKKELIARSRNNHNKHFCIARRLRKKMRQKNMLFHKTELCTYWMNGLTCKFKAQCQFAHGIEELASRTRPGNFKTQLCKKYLKCFYGSRCSYCHPGEPIRRVVDNSYVDVDYYIDLRKDFGDNKYPFGIYI